MFRKFRIIILLFILATVGLESWRAQARTFNWERTVTVGIYPIAADNSPATQRFIAALNEEDFAQIGQWLGDQGKQYGASLAEPVSIWLGPVIQDSPPLPPSHASALEAITWSLKMRWWAWEYDRIGKMKPLIRLFVLFHDPALNQSLPHSVGLAKGKIGIIHAFASQQQSKQNAVIITHELLHTFGATDKYDLSTLQPIHPQGYAEPELQPVLPQTHAEIMGGRIPVDARRSEIPLSLAYTVIGPQTAREIGLLRSEH